MTHFAKHAAQTDHPVLEPIAHRWSPYVFDPRPVEGPKLAACLEAARWAASSYNEQPWRFLLARREDDASFQRMLACLVDPNRVWAQHAGALLLTVVSTHFSQNGKLNRVAVHDLGLAMGQLCIQATALGLVVHQMGGVDLERIRATYAIPEGFDPVTGVAIGYLGDPAQADAELVQRDQGARRRRPLHETVFADQWGLAAGW